MHTTVTLGGPVPDRAADRFFARVAESEALLSRFRPTAEMARVAAGRLHPDEADPRLRSILERCERLRDATDGDFEHEPRRRGGGDTAPALDADALVKGWIVEDAALGLQAHGHHDFFVNAGGDVTVRRPAGAEPWRVGIRHPDRADAVLGVVALRHGAVATSGSYERGDHVRGAGPGRLRSVTVTGPDLGEADALATAVFAAGVPRPPWWHRFAAHHGLLTVDAGDRLRWWPPAAPHAEIDFRTA